MIKNNKQYFRCSFCGMVFKNLKLARECEQRCSKGLECHSNMIHKSVSF